MKKKVIVISVLLLIITTLFIAILGIQKRSSSNNDATLKTHTALRDALSSKNSTKTQAPIFSFVNENQYCKNLNDPKCTLIDLGELYLNNPDKWGDPLINSSKEKCKNNNGEGCEIYATYLFDLKNYSESLKYFEKACQLGEKENCCKAIWIQDRATVTKQNEDEKNKMFSDLKKENCFTDYPDSTVFGINDQIERNGDYETYPYYYITLLIHACRNGSSRGCYEAAQKMTALGRPYAHTQTLYELSCIGHEDGACEEYSSRKKHSINEKHEQKGNPEYSLDGSYTFNMGVFNNSLIAERELILYETKGFWSAINEISNDQFMVVVGKFKSKKEAESFLKENKYITENYKFISKFD